MREREKERERETHRDTETQRHRYSRALYFSPHSPLFPPISPHFTHPTFHPRYKAGRAWYKSDNDTKQEENAYNEKERVLHWINEDTLDAPIRDKLASEANADQQELVGDEGSVGDPEGGESKGGEGDSGGVAIGGATGGSGLKFKEKVVAKDGEAKDADDAKVEVPAATEVVKAKGGWYPATVMGVTGNGTSGEPYTYCLRYDDGDECSSAQEEDMVKLDEELKKLTFEEQVRTRIFIHYLKTTGSFLILESFQMLTLDCCNICPPPRVVSFFAGGVGDADAA